MMKQYESYKDSGVQWIGEIPSHWDVVKLKYCCGPLKSGGTPKSDDSKLYSSEGTPWVAISDMSSTDFVYDTEKHLTQEGIDDKKLIVFPIGTILYSIYATLGKVSELKVPACINQAILALTPRKGIDRTYFKYCLQAQEQYVFSLSNGNTQNNLNAEKVANFLLVIPPLDEQESAASYLDKKCEKIDKAIATQQKRIDLLGELRQNIITHAVTRGINPDAPLKDSGVEWIGEVPEHWKIMPIKYVKSKAPNAFVDGPFGSNLKSEHFIENGEVLVIESGFITTGKFVYKDFKTISKEHFETIKRSQCKAHDIIIAKIGANYGMAGELPDLGKLSVVSGNSLKITLDNSKMLNTIFVNAMNSAKNNSGFMGMVQENAQPALSLSGLNNFKLPVPPLSEQLEIVSHIESKTDSIDKSIAKAEHQIELLQELKQSIITEVVTGKRKVC